MAPIACAERLLCSHWETQSTCPGRGVQVGRGWEAHSKASGGSWGAQASPRPPPGGATPSGTHRPGRRWGRALGARTSGLQAALRGRLPAGGGGRGRCGPAGGRARRKCRLRRRRSRAGRDVGVPDVGVPAGARRAGGRGRAAGAGAAGAGAAAPPGAEAAAPRRAAAAAAPAPGVLEDETKPEDCIPDVPGNEHAREFLAHAPTRGLWMPLGKEVKVMQCWRCKRYGHRTGDKECPFFIKGNQKLEQFRVAHEDPMYDIIRENKRHEKDIRKMKHAEIFRIMERIQNTFTQPCRIGVDVDRNGKHEKLKILCRRRIQQLKQLLEDSTSDDDGSSSSSSECRERHRKRKKKEKHKKKKKEKKRKKKRKHKSSKSSEGSDSD
ncbi:retinitis pigmentosa 9 protein isoform X2 [Pipistrellus kuhlii]|uniref:retinitis pigmentosa 9 protein isoform X2 n=1 Tax=Pipistrellus kuhlii TaxID=59472 RepID=UPI001E26F1A0|nr:retinitis pigmentosa 9 protein isoform X2 [Pipistrellus kuhlii]